MAKLNKPTETGSSITGSSITGSVQYLNQYEIRKAIVEAIQQDPEKLKKNSELFKTSIEEIINRAYTLTNNSCQKSSLSGLDCYYIPDTNDTYIKDILEDNDKIYQILQGLLCRTQYFGRDKDLNWQITEEGLSRLNYILNMAARHTLREIENATVLHSESYNRSFNKVIPGFRNPQNPPKRQLTKEEAEEDGRQRRQERSKCNNRENEHQQQIKEQQNNTNKRNIYSRGRPGMSLFFQDFKDFIEYKRSPKDNKCKVYFKIKSKEQFLQFVKILLTDYKFKLESNNEISRKKDMNGELIPKSFALRQKEGLFLKNISCFADMESCDAYTGKRTHCQQILREYIDPFLQTNRPGQTYTRKIETLSDHETKYSIKFNIPIEDHRNLSGTFIFCTKSQNSIMDKTRRDIDYSATTDLKDLFRGSFIMDNDEDVILMLHYYIKYFIQDPEHYCNHNGDFDPENHNLGGIEIKDKGQLNKCDIETLPKGTKPQHDTATAEYSNYELNWAATTYISNLKKHLLEKKKSATSTQYCDIKAIIPIVIRPNRTFMELKFLTKNSFQHNESGISSHEIFRLKQKIKSRCRDSKYVSAEKIRMEIGLLLNHNQELKNNIESYLQENIDEGEEIDTAENYIYKEIIRNLVILKYEKGQDGSYSPSIFCDKDIWEHLKENNFGFDPQIINNINRTEKK